MSAAATMSQPPIIPPRPSRSADNANSTDSFPKVPPRPAKRFDRSISPNPHRFAPSPLNESPFQPKSPRATRFFSSDNEDNHDEPIQRPGSVAMPSLGEEGNEYAAVQSDLATGVDKAMSPPSSPEQTRTVAEDLHLFAPKPSVPAQTSKQRVQAVTRTDSDRAATFGIGRASSSEEQLPDRASLKKKKSTMSQMSESDSVFDDEEHGIPEIGQRVPMNPHLGDVQAPSPAPASGGVDGQRSHTPRHHGRKHSARGFAELPPGSYGLHGHGTPQPTDKLEKAWYDKHPDSWKRESAVSLHDRQNDFAMSSTELNKIVRETRESGIGSSAGYTGTPTEEVGYQASAEYTQRMSSRPGSTQPWSPDGGRADSPYKDSPIGSPAVNDNDDVIHVDESHNRSRSFVANASEENLNETDEYQTPILASDEVAKDPNAWDMQPAVEPSSDRRGSFYDEDASSRPPSRPISLYNSTSNLELTSTPLEDVEEYEPLFPEEEEKKKKQQAEASTWKPRHKFPSKDIWEDAPESVNATAVVSTPDLPERKEHEAEDESQQDRPETPAHAFARQQEELAEQESHESENFNHRGQRPMPRAFDHIKTEEARPKAPHRFPSRDVWEDTPESLMHQATVGTPEPVEETPATTRPHVPARPQKKGSGDKPAIPERPKPKQTPSDESMKTRPVVSDKPKPQVPARPTKTLPSGIDSKEQDAAPRPKPAVPARPVGSKIQALQAGFMSDLNKRLQLGPQVPAKKEEPPAADMVPEQKEKVVLSDARKGRARGPQRRAPAARSPAPAADLKAGAPVLSFSPLRSCWSIGDDGVLELDDEKPKLTESIVAAEPDVAEVANEPKSESPIVEADQVDQTVTKEDSPAIPETESGKDSQSTVPEVSKPEEDVVSAEGREEEEEVVKTLASNTAGESIVEATVDRRQDNVEPVAVETTGGEHS